MLMEVPLWCRMLDEQQQSRGRASIPLYLVHDQTKWCDRKPCLASHSNGSLLRLFFHSPNPMTIPTSDGTLGWNLVSFVVSDKFMSVADRSSFCSRDLNSEYQHVERNPCNERTPCSVPIIRRNRCLSLKRLKMKQWCDHPRESKKAIVIRERTRKTIYDQVQMLLSSIQLHNTPSMVGGFRSPPVYTSFSCSSERHIGRDAIK